MSEAHAAPAPGPAKAGATPPVDPVEELAKLIFIQLSAQVYSSPNTAESPRPQPKAVVGMSFKLAEAFLAGNLEFNTAAMARHEAAKKASVDVSKIEIDFGAIGDAAAKK